MVFRLMQLFAEHTDEMDPVGASRHSSMPLLPPKVRITELKSVTVTQTKNIITPQLPIESSTAGKVPILSIKLSPTN